MTTDPTRARLDELLANHQRANKTGLSDMKPADAMDEVTNTLLAFRAYCKNHQFKLLNYLFEMAILEAIEVQMSLNGHKDAGANGVETGDPSPTREAGNADHRDTND